MVINNVIFVIFLFIFYSIACILFYNIITHIMTIDSPTMHLARMERYFNDNKDKLAFLLSIVWPMSWFFLLGCTVGAEIYTSKVIKGNEEDRIAAWFV